jgi:putative oxidoreductase
MIPERLAPQTYALMRIVFGFVFMILGLGKWGFFPGPWQFSGGQAVPLASLMGAAGTIESVGGLLIMLGLFTRPVAFLCSGEMAVAYFMIHQPQGALPSQNMGERAVLFCFAFLYMAARGSGIWSVDASMKR